MGRFSPVRRGVRALVYVSIALLLTLVLGVWFATLPVVQQFAAEHAASRLSEKTGSEISFERVRVHVPMDLRGVAELRVFGAAIIDPEGEQLWRSGEITVRVSLPALLQRRVVITHAAVDRAGAYFYRCETTGKVNLITLVEQLRRRTGLEADRDAVRRRHPEDSRGIDPWRVEIRTAELSRSQVRLAGTGGHSEWRLQDLSLNVSGLEIAGGQVSGRVRDMSFTERTGLAGDGIELTELSALVTVSRSGARAEQLRARTQNSLIVADLSAEVSAWGELPEAPEDLVASVDIDELHLSIQELANAFPGIAFQDYFGTPGIPEVRYPQIRVQGKAHGGVAELAVPELRLRLGEHSSFRGAAVLRDLAKGRDGSMELNVEALELDRRDLAYFVSPGQIREAPVPEHLALSGRLRGGRRQLALQLRARSTYGDLAIAGEADRVGGVDGYAYRLGLETERFEVGRVLPIDTPLGAAALQLRAEGRGRTLETLTAEVSAHLPDVEVHGEVLQDVTIEAQYQAGRIAARGAIDDARLAGAGWAKLDLLAREPRYRGELVVERAELGLLGIVPHMVQVAGTFTADAAGGSPDTVTGRFGLSDLRVRHGQKTGSVSSAEVRTHNVPGHTHIVLESEVAGGELTSTVPLTALPGVLHGHAQQFFRLPETPRKRKPEHQFVLHADIKELYPVLAGFFPELQALSPGSLRVEFDGAERILDAGLAFDRVSYGAVDIAGLQATARSDTDELSYDLQAAGVAAGALFMHSPRVYGAARDNRWEARLSLQDAEERELLRLGTVLEARETAVVARLMPDDIIIRGEQWVAPEDHEIRFERDRITVHNIRVRSGEQWVSARTREEPDGTEPLEIDISNVALTTIGGPLGVPEERLSGLLNGSVEVLLRESEPLVVAELAVSDLRIEGLELGRVSLELDNRIPGRFTGGFAIEHQANRARGTGYAIPSEGIARIEFEIGRLDLAYLEAVTLAELTDTEGYMNGSGWVGFDSGREDPVFGEGELGFHEARVAPAALNTAFFVDDQRIAFSDGVLVLSDFVVHDTDGNKAVAEGDIEFPSPAGALRFKLAVRADRFIVMDTAAAHNDQLYGRIVIDSDLQISGTRDEPVVEGSAGLQQGSAVTFVMPDRAPIVHEGEGVVRFVDADERYAVPRGTDRALELRAEDMFDATFDRLELSVNVVIDPDTRLTMIVDPQSGDRLRLRGGGNLSLAVVPGGTVTLSGSYTVSQGDYELSFYTITRRRFVIQPGSTVVWTGDPLDAELNIDAVYSVRASPENLFAAYVPDQERGVYRTELPFQVVLIMRGRLTEPDISFELDMPAEQRGALGGAVYRRIQQLNEHEADRNRQAFALIVLNQFIADDLTGVDQTAALVPGGRSSAARILTQQLNVMAGRILPGTDLRFDVESYEEYTEEGPEGRTEVHVDITQRLFGDRLIVQLGGRFDVEGERRREAEAGEFAGDVTLEYLVTEDGRYRLRGFRLRQYEGPVEGTVTSTGLSVLYTRQFDRVRDLFRRVDPDHPEAQATFEAPGLPEGDSPQ